MLNPQGLGTARPVELRVRRCIDRHRGGPVRCFGNAQDGRIGVEEDLPVTTVLTIGPHRNHTAHQIEIEQVDLGETARVVEVFD